MKTKRQEILHDHYLQEQIHFSEERDFKRAAIREHGKALLGGHAESVTRWINFHLDGSFADRRNSIY